MSRQTSVEAWFAVQKSLPASRAKVLEAIVRHPNMTGREIEARLAGLRVARKSNARISELAQQGMVEESGVRKCTVTGCEAVTWRWTGRKDPIPLPKRKTVAKRVDVLERQIVELRLRYEQLSAGGVQ